MEISFFNMLRLGFKLSGLDVILFETRVGQQIASNPERSELLPNIFKLFQHLPRHPLNHILTLGSLEGKASGELLKRRLFPYSFQPREDRGGSLSYDPAIWNVKNGTFLSGYFQSTKYFCGWEAGVRQWFKPPVSIVEQVNEHINTLPCSPRRDGCCSRQIGRLFGSAR